MSIFKQCSFYRDSENPNMGRGIGFCDLDGNQTVCDGDINFCEKPEVLKKYLNEQKRREEGLEGEKRRNVHFLGGQRLRA